MIGSMEGPVPAREAARILGVTARHVARLAGRGELAYQETPLGRLYDRADLERRRARPPRRGRPPTGRRAPEPVDPTRDGTLVFLEETATVLDECGRPASVFEAGHIYPVSTEVARLLVERGVACCVK